MKYIPAHIRNMNGVTPLEEVPPLSPAEVQSIKRGLSKPVPAQLAVADVVRLRLLPIAEQHLPKLTIREHKKITDFEKWFLTLGRATTIEIDGDALREVECVRFSDYHDLPKLKMAQSGAYHVHRPYKELVRATISINTVATLPEYDDKELRLRADTVMLSAPNSPLEKSGAHSFNMAYLTEL